MTLEEANRIAQQRIAELEAENALLRKAGMVVLSAIGEHTYGSLTVVGTMEVRVALRALKEALQEGG